MLLFWFIFILQFYFFTILFLQFTILFFLFIFFFLIHDPNTILWYSVLAVYHTFSRSSIKKQSFLFENDVSLLHMSPSKTHLEWISAYLICHIKLAQIRLRCPLPFWKWYVCSPLIMLSPLLWLTDWHRGFFKKSVHLHTEGLHTPGVTQLASVKPTKSWCADNKWASAVFIYSR